MERNYWILCSPTPYLMRICGEWKSGQRVDAESWVQGPRYLVDGGGRPPLGRMDIDIKLHDQTTHLPAVILLSNSCALPVVLGLNFVFFSGLQFDESESTYWFNSNLAKKYFFMDESAISPEKVLKRVTAFYSAVLSAMMSPPPPPAGNLDETIQCTHLDDAGKRQLFHLLQQNSESVQQTLVKQISCHIAFYCHRQCQSDQIITCKIERD